MADEFRAGICAENWWMNPSQSTFGSSVCSPIVNNMDIISWPTDFDMKTKASDDQSGSANSEGSIIFQDTPKPFDQDGSCSALNSTLEMMDTNLSSSITADWNQTLLHDSKTNECNYQGIHLGSLNYRQDAAVDHLSDHIKKDWNPRKFSTINEISSMDAYKGPTNEGFPVSSSSYSYTSSLMQNLFDTDPAEQDTNFGNQSMEYPPLSNNCQGKLNEFPSSSLMKPSVLLPKRPLSHLNLPNNLAWNASNDGLCTSVQSQFFSPKFTDKLNCSSLSVKSNNERNRDMRTVVKNISTEGVFKRQRMQTPSPLPTFKVRKEKLGDRVTALQQLVSPFGKTDTASVLHEAIEYIKLVHDQVAVLITPYIKGGSTVPHEQTLRDPKGTNQELRSRGLCLVPISSTFPVASETTADFWTPTFGGSFSLIRNRNS
ncbi:transcription factor bHLH112 [Heracleum sosnowskyi]|uniref:Transcription factor bHLH112 n=1 Tax=Heracleum sosnowskyi TaxID=360622 RepID=A0AAD8MCE3_9APIA|nr:transcription factor bHLH112 [Heracleum sosnowskyi]